MSRAKMIENQVTGEESGSIVDRTAADLDTLRQDLSQVQGRDYWKRLEQLSASAPFQKFLEREFPSQALRWMPSVQRRDFLRLMSGSLALAGMGACTRQPEEKIVPFAKSPEERIPGRPEYFATTMSLAGVGLGLLVESHSGRPTKVEGNPDHPSSRGATESFAQAAVLGLYDPDRAHSVQRAGQISTWEEFKSEMQEQVERAEAKGGQGLAILVDDHGSPTLHAQLESLGAKLPKSRLYQWTAVHDDAVRAGSQRAFGADLRPRYALDRAQVVVSLDSDFLACGLESVQQAGGFAERRQARLGVEEFNRLFAVECSPNLTGAMADHRLTLKPSEVEGLTRALAAAVGAPVQAPELSGRAAVFVEAAAKDLREAGPGALVLAGRWQPQNVQALAFQINAALGAVGTTVEFAPPSVPTVSDHAASLADLIGSMRAGEVETLVMLGGNPVFDAPADLDFKAALRQVGFRAHLSLHQNETGELCHWHVPEAHFLESWSDARAVDGTASIVQPLIAPLYGGKTAHELVGLLAGEGGKSAHDHVRGYWSQTLGLTEDSWLTALHDGVLAGTTIPAVALSLQGLDLGPSPQAEGGLEIALRPDACTWDGRFANNAWLQETPRPLTRLTWDNAALVSPPTAKRLECKEGDVLRFEAAGRELEVAVHIMPGHPDEVVSLHLGYGRTKCGVVGEGVGFDVYQLRTSFAQWSLTGVTAEKTGRSYELVGVQKQLDQDGRNLARNATFEHFTEEHGHVFEGHAHGDPGALSLYEGWDYSGYAWGMVIDLNACIGCSACMVACQSENNIPVVGKEEVSRGREMHWIRIDRYYEHEGVELDAADLIPDDVTTLHQPIPCMHCEQAPCEVVCPVGATTHSPEGLNEMTYNRCVGTRYCSNNCPYKVRRFNFFKYADYDSDVLALGNNPDVTVRHRGVMEKCTYCVQRINHARIDAKKDDRKIREGDIVTACQSICPTRAITFGDINDPESAVSKLRAQPHHYGLLEETGTRPRTTYLAKLLNPNAAVSKS